MLAKNIILIFNSLFPPYLVAGTCGLILLYFCMKKEHALQTAGVYVCILLMLLARVFCPYLRSSRYSENLLVFFAFGSAFFLKNWDIVFCRINRHRPWMKLIRDLAILISLIAIALKFFHYNPYQNYVKMVAACIQNDRPQEKSMIVTSNPQDIYLPDMPQDAMPDFLKEAGFERDYLLRTIRHYQFITRHIYLTTNKPLEFFDLPPEDRKRITQLGRFRKNRKGHQIYVFRYDCPPWKSSLRIVQTPFYTAEKNLMRNGDMEKHYISGPNSYYARIQASPKKGVIPPGALFPDGWDIFCGIGFGNKTKALLYSTDENPIGERYSLRVQSNKTVSFLYDTSILRHNYLLQCDLRPLKKCTFGLQFNLRDTGVNFRGFRELERVSLDEPGKIYHYEIQLTEEMLYPLDRFYLYFFFYDESDILIDHISLTEIQ